MVEHYRSLYLVDHGENIKNVFKVQAIDYLCVGQATYLLWYTTGVKISFTNSGPLDFP